jgi:tetratricopeptide (TPR) repeat protein
MKASDRVGLAVPPPPGVEPVTLSLRDPDDDAAWFALPDVVDQYQGRWNPAIEEVVWEDPTPEQQRQALRHYIKGRHFAMRDGHLVAVTELEQAEDLDPNNSSILRELARGYIELGNTSKAIDIYERLLSIDPEHDEARFTLGMVAVRRRNYVETVAILGPGVVAGNFKHDPAAPMLASLTLADALRHLGHDRAMIEAADASLNQSRPISQSTRYAPQFGAAYRRRGERWRAIGDAYCRLGNFEAALQAYSASSALPLPDPASLLPRAVFANVRLGYVRAAHAALLARLEVDPEAITDRDILLCEYVAEYAPPVDVIGKAVVELYEQYPDDAGTARAAASFLPPEQAMELLSRFVRERPDDQEVVAQLIGWLALLDLKSAVEFAMTLARENPDRAEVYARQLPNALPDPAAALGVIADINPSAAQGFIESTLRSALGDFGGAWSTCAAARQRWPDDANLALLQVGLAADLREPELVNSTAEAAAVFDTAAIWLAISRASMIVGDTDQAMKAAEIVVDREPDNVDALTQLARAQAAAAIEAIDSLVKRYDAERAVATAEAVLQLDPGQASAFDVLLGVYGPDGALEDLTFYRQTAQRLLQSDPDSSLYRQLAAREAISQRRFDDAVESLIGLYEADPSDRESLNLAMLAWTGLDRLPQAQQWVERHLQERPGDPALMEQWVRLQLRQGREDEALAALHERLDADPGDVVVRRLLESVYGAIGRGQEALQYGEARLLAQPLGVKRELDLASLYTLAGRQEEAFQRLEWFSRHADWATYEYLLSALALTLELDTNQRLNNLRLSLAEQTVRRFPEAPLSVYAAGLISLSLVGDSEDRFDELIARAVKSQVVRGRDLEAALIWLDLVQLLLNAGVPGTAGRAVRARLDSGDPLDPEAYALLVRAAIATDAVAEEGIGRTMRLMHQLEQDAALGVVARLSRRPTLADALQEVSMVYSIVGNDDGAEELLLEALRLDPQDAMLMNNLGYTRIEAGRHDPETIEMIEMAIQLDPEDPNILDTVAWLRYKQGRFDDPQEVDGAVQLIRRAIERSEIPSPEVYDHLGDLLWRANKPEEALQSWRDALEILEDDSRQQRLLREYLLLQTRHWGVLVADPQELYDRDYGRIHDRLRAKVEAIQRGEDPELAPTFAELEVHSPAS